MQSITRWALLYSLLLFTASYCDAAPSVQWFKSFGAAAAMPGGQPLVDANSEFAYAWLTSPGGNSLHKIDSLGNVLWTRPVDIGDDNHAISVDDIGNAYLSWGAADWHVQKHNPDGDVAWTRTYDATRADRPYAGTLADSSGNVYVGGAMTGSFHPSQGVWDHDAALGQLDSAGNVLWTRQWGTPDHDYLDSMAIGNLGHVFVGERWLEIGSPGGVPSRTTISKLTDTGDLLWARQLSGFGSVFAVDDLGNSFVNIRPHDNNYYYLTKLSADGDVVWTRDVDDANLAAMDAQGNFYFASYGDTELRKYSPNGEPLWTLPVASGAPGNIFSIDVDDRGNIFVSGRTLGVAGPVLDVWLARVVEQVPEPSTAILLFGGLATSVLGRRRRRSSGIRS